MPICKDIIKHRVIRFKDKSGDTAARARVLLSAVQGISKARQSRPNQVSIHYDIRELNLQMIEQALADVGFELDDSVFCKVKRGLIAYCEDTLRESLNINQQESTAPKLNETAHSTGDPRPYNWRNYT